MYQHLENLYYLMNQEFESNKSIILQNHAWMNDLVKVQELTGYNLTEFEKFVNIFLEHHLTNIF